MLPPALPIVDLRLSLSLLAKPPPNSPALPAALVLVVLLLAPAPPPSARVCSDTAAAAATAAALAEVLAAETPPLVVGAVLFRRLRAAPPASEAESESPSSSESEEEMRFMAARARAEGRRARSDDRAAVEFEIAGVDVLAALEPATGPSRSASIVMRVESLPGQSYCIALACEALFHRLETRTAEAGGLVLSKAKITTLRESGSMRERRNGSLRYEVRALILVTGL